MKYSSSYVVHPGPIDNSRILANASEQDQYRLSKRVERPRLKERLHDNDIVAISVKFWNLLVEEIGLVAGQPILKRRVVMKGQKLAVDLYPSHELPTYSHYLRPSNSQFNMQQPTIDSGTILPTTLDDFYHLYCKLNSPLRLSNLLFDGDLA